MTFQTKQCDLQVKDVDAKGRTVQIYVSAFGNKDSDGDIIIPGAYKKSIAESGPQSLAPRIKHLRQHQTDRLIGKPLEMVEDAKGLLVTSQIAKTTEGDDALGLYALDLFEHSVGIRTIKSQQDHQANANILQELAMREYSSVTWGANDQTPLVGMKSLTKETQLSKLSQRMAKIAKALRTGSLTDDAFIMLELEVDQLEKAYKDLIAPLLSKAQPDATERTTEKHANEPDARELINYFKNSLTY